MSISLIELNEAGKFYLDKRFTLLISTGDFIVIKGINGSGKTTLLNLINGFTVNDFGQIYRKPIRISYLPEREVLPLYVNTHHYLLEVARIKKAHLDYRLITDFEIPLSKSIHTLSKGNRQKVMLVSCLTGYYSLLVLDEPLSGLDSKAVRVLKKYLKKLNEKNVAIVISTHKPERFKDLAQKVIEL